jgi:hypothetical protein
VTLSQAAAALALVVWYLVAPPLNEKTGDPQQLPVYKWDVVSPFDNEAACKSELTRLGKAAQSDRASDPVKARIELYLSAFAYCFESDNPIFRGRFLTRK